MDFVETNFTRWANYCVGIIVLLTLFSAALVSFHLLFP
jgi:hypothetical protein